MGMTVKLSENTLCTQDALREGVEMREGKGRGRKEDIQHHSFRRSFHHHWRYRTWGSPLRASWLWCLDGGLVKVVAGLEY